MKTTPMDKAINKNKTKACWKIIVVVKVKYGILSILSKLL
jgi:hypothetical protein